MDKLNLWENENSAMFELKGNVELLLSLNKSLSEISQLTHASEQEIGNVITTFNLGAF